MVTNDFLVVAAKVETLENNVIYVQYKVIGGVPCSGRLIQGRYNK